MNQLQKVFNYGKAEVRTVIKDGEVWFVAKDVSDILEFRDAYTATRNLDDDEKLLHTLSVSGQNREITIINEPGLYSLILRSNKPEAKQFKRWVTHEVLPFIRKTGRFEMGQASYIIDDPIKRAEKWIEEQKERLMLEQRVKEYEPKVNYVDKILESKDAVNVTQIAKDYDLSGKKLNQILHEEGIQFNSNGQWLLYRKYQGLGYTKSKTTEYRKRDGSMGTKLHTRWTQKGRLFIHDILAKRDILPILDRSA
ncbi:phage antirepressor KilAC domain-containing protein [Radiobacillus kanasensis]|uniref:phage antirepressor KilAC domain-containing protein n=1 Tax=Radiobacillus kanasensis TaxID=2844358 RepID=UPI001E3EBF44|nr:phage antirepressor KilAC domain-containing protein [Radiobacillus kanasensis]UFU00342.1 phage antirepressor KilAC domain-containing protein [Radiobacillus kanasensis]